MNIQPIVEGHGEVSAFPVLLRRLRDLSQAFAMDVNAPIRRKRSELVKEDGLRRSVQLAVMQPMCGCIIVLFDSDDDCPKELAPQLQDWARREARNIPCRVIMATREYEAWFLASMESLRGSRGIRHDAVSHSGPETPRDAKSRLEGQMLTERSYSETADQAALSARFDMRPAYQNCRSFRHLVKAFGELALACGTKLENWPPPKSHETDV
jgi:Domain of unknown function (DUF4276)